MRGMKAVFGMLLFCASGGNRNLTALQAIPDSWSLAPASCQAPRLRAGRDNGPQRSRLANAGAF